MGAADLRLILQVSYVLRGRQPLDGDDALNLPEVRVADKGS